MNRVAAVIGSNCFTGSHIVDALLGAEWTVVGLSRSREYEAIFLPYKARPSPNFRFYQVDLVRQGDRLLDILDDARPECVINVAALSEVALSNFQPLEYFQTNTLGVVNLCNELRSREYLRRYVHISSAEVYGNCTGSVKEDAPLIPSTPYAASKAAADMYLLTLRKNFDFSVSLVRSTNVYGRHQQPFKIIPRTVIFLRQGRRIELHGGGKAVKSFVHVRDVAAGVMKIVEAEPPAGVYHFSTKNSQTVAEIVEMLCSQMGKDFRSATVSVGERLGQDTQYLLDWSKAADELDWAPQVSLRDGLDDAIAWVEESWDEILRHPLEYVHKV
ncbi:MAG: NAD-dependent epimerase/dehydratase family protein [Nitrospinota bacterium]